MAISLPAVPVQKQERLVKVGLVVAAVAGVVFAIWYFVLRKPADGSGGSGGGPQYNQGYYQGVIDALQHVPGAGTIGGIGQMAPGGGGSAALGSGQGIAPGVLPTERTQAYRPPSGGGQA